MESVRDLVEAVPEDVGMSSARLHNLTRLVQGYIDDGKVAGAISLVTRRDRLVHSETYGMMDAEAGTPMRPDTIFRIASMTKPIASVGLMTLYEEGHFQLDTPVAEFIPAFSEVKVFAGGTADSYEVRSPSRPIAIADLLRHTAGFEAMGVVSPVGALYARAGVRPFHSSTGTLAERADQLARLPLAYDPGTRFTYDYASDLVGRLCELISGRPFDAMLDERIFGPLGMPDTSFHVFGPKRNRLAANYELVADATPQFRRMADGADARYAEGATYLSAAGGLTSTAADYLRFCRMLARGGELDGERILGPRTMRYMTVNHFPRNVDFAEMGQPTLMKDPMAGAGFGLGFAVLLDPLRCGTMGTAGEYYWSGAYTTAFFVAPAEDMIAIFMTQLAAPSAYPIRRQLRTTIYSALLD